MKAQFICNVGKRNAFADQFFRFVRFQVQINAVNAFSRRLLKAGAEVRFSVVKPIAKFFERKLFVNAGGKIAHDLVLQVGGSFDFGNKKSLRRVLFVFPPQ